MQSLRFWSSVYSSEMSSSASEDLVEVSESESTSSSAEASPDSQMPAMTRSCEDLSKEADDRAFQNPLQRRLSDPNLARDFPASLVLSEPNRVIPSLLCRDPVNGCDVSELSAAARESGCANGVDKCPSVETLKGHEDDERAADNGISRSTEKHKNPFIVNGEFESRASYCDTLNNNDGLGIKPGVGSTEAGGAAECWQAPSSTFEDSDDTLTGFSDLTQPISSNCSSMNTSANISPQNGLNSRYGDEFWTKNGAAGPGAGGSEGNPVSLDDSESAAAVKVMLEKCSSTSDLIRWESDNRHRANARSRCAGARCAVVNASDTVVTQQFAVSGGPQQKTVAGVLSVDTSRSSPPGQSSMYAISFANIKELDLAGVHMSSGCSSNPISPSSEAKVGPCCIFNLNCYFCSLLLLSDIDLFIWASACVGILYVCGRVLVCLLICISYMYVN